MLLKKQSEKAVNHVPSIVIIVLEFRHLDSHPLICA